MERKLQVRFQEHSVGTITLSSLERMEFQYAAGWLESKSAFPISVALPLRTGRFEESAHNFFSNLLPEADVRQRVCLRLKVTPGNDFELLRLIGGECAGALTISDWNAAASQPTMSREPEYRRIKTEQLAEWSRANSNNVFSSTVGENSVRLSLAGAQDKLPVRVEGDQIWLPLSESPSTHLLKFASPNFRSLPENEYFVTRLARAAGLTAVESDLFKPARGASMLLVARYDRIRAGVQIERLHQEDLCQALGRSPLRKYEKEGGPALREVAEIIRQHASLPALDLEKLIRWSLFNWLVGNSDGHGKNLSLLFRDHGQIDIAPFYDLVCTRVYKTVDRNMAMGIGGEFDPGQIGRRQLEQLAREIQVSGKLVLALAQELCQAIESGIASVLTKIPTEYQGLPIFENVSQLIRKNVRRARTQLK